MDYNLPKRIMACAPFLQRMGWEQVRPEQNFNLNFDYLHIRRHPTEYPLQQVEHSLGFRAEPALHGLATLQPYSEDEIIRNSNHEK